MVANPRPTPPHPGVPHHTRRPRRLTALERVIERAEDRFDQREVRRQKIDPEEQRFIPFEEVERHLGL